MYLGEIRKATSYLLESLATGFAQSPTQEWIGYGTSTQALSTFTVTDTQWQMADYLEAIDWAGKTAARLLELTSNFLNTITVPASNNIILLPNAPLKIVTVLDPAMNIIQPSSETLENTVNPAWRTLTGTPTGWYAENGNTIRLNRMAPVGGLAITVQVIEPPVSIPSGATQNPSTGVWSASNAIQNGADSDTMDPRLPDNVQKALRFGAAAYLLIQAGDAEDLGKAETLKAKFFQELGVKP